MMQKKILTKELVNSSAYYSFFKHIGLMPNPDKILKRSGKTIEAYRDLKNDAHVWSCIQSRKSGVLSMKYIIESDNSALKRFIEELFRKLNIRNLISDILESLLFGWQPMEIVWKLENRKLIPEKIQSKKQEFFQFDEKGKLYYKSDGSHEKQKAPEMKFLIAVHEENCSNPYGSALLAKCYWPVTFKNASFRFWVNFMEKYGMPLMLGQYSRGASQDEAEKLALELSNMSEDSVIVAPHDIDINLHEATRSSSVELYQSLIKQCNSEISKALLSQTLTTELSSGSLAAAETHFKIRREIIKSDAKLVESTINQLIKYITKLNFGKNENASFYLEFDDTENTSKLDRDLKINSSSNIKLSKSYWKKSYGFKDEDFQ